MELFGSAVIKGEKKPLLTSGSLRHLYLFIFHSLSRSLATIDERVEWCHWKHFLFQGLSLSHGKSSTETWKALWGVKRWTKCNFFCSMSRNWTNQHQVMEVWGECRYKNLVLQFYNQMFSYLLNLSPLSVITDGSEGMPNVYWS